MENELFEAAGTAKSSSPVRYIGLEWPNLQVFQSAWFANLTVNDLAHASGTIKNPTWHLGLPVLGSRRLGFWLAWLSGSPEILWMCHERLP